MKLAIMQPYFFPYIGYFQLIYSVDRFIIFDTPQYKKRSWMNRNRIINIKEGTTYITVPIIKASQKTPINEIYIDESQDWRNHILDQLNIYKNKAPFYFDVIHLIEKVFTYSNKKLAELNLLSIQKCCEYLDIPFYYEIFSKMNLYIPELCKPDEWALNITKAMGYDTYINAPNGETFFDKSKYEADNITLKFIHPILTPYIQKLGRFESGLSIIDVMMFNSKDKIREMLGQYELQ